MTWGIIVGTLALGAGILAWARRRSVVDLKPFVGTPTQEMQDWAQAIVDSNAPFGTKIPRVFNGRIVVARVEHHTKQAKTGKEGDFRGVTLYEPK